MRPLQKGSSNQSWPTDIHRSTWSVPFAVLLAVPIGAFGAITALTLIKSLSNNIYAQIGLITLIGLAAKNAILIVAFAKEKSDRVTPLFTATIDAVKLRLRPIIMTSMAFILGVLPLAFRFLKYWTNPINPLAFIFFN